MSVILGLLLGASARADEFSAQPLGKELVSDGWTCSTRGEGTYCIRPDRVHSLRGIWTAERDADGKVRKLTFSAFWVPFEVPERSGQPPSQTTHTPLEDATEALQRMRVGYLSDWEIVSTAPAFVVYQRAGERRTLAVWESELLDEGGRAYVIAGLHVQREFEPRSPDRPR